MVALAAHSKQPDRKRRVKLQQERDLNMLLDVILVLSVLLKKELYLFDVLDAY